MHIQNCDSSAKMWDKPHYVFEKKNETSLLLIQQKFSPIGMLAFTNLRVCLANIKYANLFEKAS